MVCSTVLRSTFDDAVGFFPDDFFGLVYVDGYAHTGQNGGHTLELWWDKVAPGGLFAGHDYHADGYPGTFHNVNVFANSRNLVVFYTSEECSIGQGEYFSWPVSTNWFREDQMGFLPC